MTNQAAQAAHWSRQSGGAPESGNVRSGGGAQGAPGPRKGFGGCPMGVECVSNKLHGGLAGSAGVGQGQNHHVGAGAMQRVASSGIQTPISHGNDHWLVLAASEVPVGVRTMLGSGVGWRTHHAEHKWWGFDGQRYYAWLFDGPAPGLSGPGLGQTNIGASNCCQTNSGLYWIAGAIFTLAVAVTANVVKKGKKKS